ncbi:unnamed protein product [Symbiodinium microadriaticum]|nr:unnamed protein product [Symbiodinium microadriaticum]
MPESDGAAGLRERELRRSGALGAASSKTTRTKGPEAQRHKVRPRKAAKHIEVAPGCLLVNLRSKGVTAADTGKRTLLPDSAAHKTEKAPATRSRIRGCAVEGSDSCDIAKESEILAKPSSFHGEGYVRPHGCSLLAKPHLPGRSRKGRRASQEPPRPQKINRSAARGLAHYENHTRVP